MRVRDQLNPFEKALALVSPAWALKRCAFRQVLDLQQRAQAATYRSAERTRTDTEWFMSEEWSGVPDLDLTTLRELRNRARQVANNNLLASSILDRAVENVIGPTGLKLQVLSGDDAWNKKAQRLFDDYFPEADFYGRSWVQHQRILAYGLFRDGDIGVAYLRNGQLQTVGSAYISSPYTNTSAFLHDGIEVDKSGRTARYYLFSNVDGKNPDWKTISPDYFAFIANKRREVQYRGATYFAPGAFRILDQLEGYIEAGVLNMRMTAMLALFIKMNSPDKSVAGLPLIGGDGGAGGGKREFKLEPGMIQTLLPGESIEQIDPVQPGTNFSDNLRIMVRFIGVCFGLPLEYVLLDFSQVSGATAKASALQAQRAFECTQRLLIDDYFRRVARWKIDEFIEDGLLEDRPDKYHHRWHAEPWPYLDAVKEIQAQLLEIDGGLASRREVLLSRNKDPEQIERERAQEVAVQRAAGIPLLHTIMVTDSTAPAPTPAAEGSEREAA